MVDVVLVTGQVMPHGPPEEDPILVAALEARGRSAAVEPWGGPACLDARLVVVRTTWDYTERLAEFLGWLELAAAAVPVMNPSAVITWNSHKSYLLDLAQAGVPVIPTALITRGAARIEATRALAAHDGEVVIKPAVSVGAHATVRAEAASGEAAEHLGTLLETGDVLIQPFAPTIAEGEVSLVYFGREYSHAVRKVPASGDFRVQVFHGGENRPHLATPAELAAGQLALAAVDGDVAYARVDLVESDRGPVLMELELIEPQLFLEQDGAADRYAAHLCTVLAGID
jgi:glutathione synthase/RimK-type ligase-like ATP-grasp enzyme